MGREVGRWVRVAGVGGEMQGGSGVRNVAPRHGLRGSDRVWYAGMPGLV